MRRGRHKLAARRRALGHTQESLAEILDVAVSTVARWEQGAGCPLPALRRPLADAISVSLESLDRLLSGDDASEEEETTTPHGNAKSGLTFTSGLVPSVPTGPGATMVEAAQWLAWHLWQHRASHLHQSRVPAAVARDLAIHPHVSLDGVAGYRFTDPALIDVLVAHRLFGDISCGSGHLLATAQTSHATDLTLGAMAAHDETARGALALWSRQGATAVLRVNAAGVLAKIGTPDLGDAAILAIRADHDARQLYLTAVASRVLDMPWEEAGQFAADVDQRPDFVHAPWTEGKKASAVQRLVSELGNRRDHAARWCSAILLVRLCDQAPDLVRNAVGRALGEEPCRENLRAYAAVLAGTNPMDP
jgi:transcriptional regulator with XRE-family HTH domain